MLLVGLVAVAPAIFVGTAAAEDTGTAAVNNETPVVNTSTGVTTYTAGGTAATVDPDLKATDNEGDTVEGARVVIQNRHPGDTLEFTSQHGITGSYDSSTGILTLSGTETPSEYEDVFRSVTFSNTETSPNASDRRITFSLGTKIPYGENGHFYEYIDDSEISWDDANASANSKSYLGLQGYLVTVTSQDENDFVAQKLQGDGWIGASDDTSFSYISEDDSGHDQWYWVTGPESGTHFWTGDDGEGFTCDTDGCGEAVSGQYSNWDNGINDEEPNDYFGEASENYAHFYYEADGKWNDFPNAQGADGYVVEYGGLESDPTVTWQDTKVVEVKLNSPPSITADAASVTVDEGSTVINGGTVSDDGGSVTLSASVGTVENNGDGTWSWSFDASDGPDDSQTVTVTAEDNNGETASVSFDLTVENVVPELTAEVEDSGVASSPVSVSGTFTDAGINDTHSVEINWGDSTTSSASVTQGAGSGSFTGSHTYESGGEYDVTVTVTDDDGGVNTHTETTTVAHLAEVDVKPDSADNPVNPTVKGVLPVAILNTSNLDGSDIDVSSLRLTATEDGVGAPAAHGGHYEDVDDDGDLDLVIHFKNEDIGLDAETSTVYLSGSTADGIPVVGSDSVTPVGNEANKGKDKGNAKDKGNDRGR